MNDTKKVYISLPISGYDLEERRDAAMKMEIKLRACGYSVFNPLGEHFVTGLTTYEYMQKDIAALLDCDTVIFMNGFNRSAGCHTELCVAMACGKKIWFEYLEQALNITKTLQNGKL